MKANEIIIRQDRVVYTLMLIFAGLGLIWSIWQHRHNLAIPGLPSQTQASASTPMPAHPAPVR